MNAVAEFLWSLFGLLASIGAAMFAIGFWSFVIYGCWKWWKNASRFSHHPFFRNRRRRKQARRQARAA